MKENSVRKDDINAELKILDDFANLYGNTVGMTENDYKKIRFVIDNILSDYKRVLKENEELNKNYNSLIDKIILKINEYDYKFKKAKKQNKNDIADYYWDLIINFKKLLGGE